ncbi:5-oxoprolinase subunit PxpA [Mongoliitalea daihaiensis]|uniref:5-oxoprolinase subunit PxpA n=1 Tax=Mongoliitalea daihaiensis TaxID=2782006 RepID=UPI001EFF19BD|nr:5-oxoprolinase subunit PxpA [Mongoliitalea daihaiensis]UJP64110.1 5-oxoprolinase subunit PxpA [Mongoliitalea daihaiensis]
MDINCDLGEGLPNDPDLMPFIHSCNIACGGHAGDINSIRQTILLAAAHGVNIGAHPSYPDRVNFGRKVMDITLEALKSSILEQLTLFFDVAKACKAPVHHIKAHGALYNIAAKDEAVAGMLIDILQHNHPEVILYAPPKSVLATLAAAEGLPIMLEVFGDRTYENDYSLVSRTHPQALITNVVEASEHVQILFQGKVRTIDGSILPLQADTLCIHGDNLSALAILQAIQHYVPHS